jgi:hypothetical protein
MEEAVTSPAAYLPTSEGLFLDTSGLPEYWAWNNFGADDRFANREGINVDDDNMPNDLPARPFVGLSAKAQAKIDATFFAWFDGEIALGVSSKGKFFGRHAKRGGNPSNRGQFSPLDQ